MANHPYSLLGDLFQGLRIDDPLESDGLRVFPLHHNDGPDPQYDLIDDLLERGDADIEEIGSGQVPTVRVTNRARRDALILNGAELHGALQNRIVNITIIAGKQAQTDIPVSCIEAGRWAFRDSGSRRSAKFRSAGRASTSELRSVNAFSVAASLRRRRDASGDQQRVWGQVDEVLEASATDSPTRSLADAFVSCAKDIETPVNALQDIDAHGAVVSLRGKIVALDLLDHPTSFRKLWKGILHGYAIDARIRARSEKQVAGEEDMTRE